MISIATVLAIFTAYLIGSIPSAVWIGKIFYGIDVREYGSGNSGATNTFRTLGKNAGIPDAVRGGSSLRSPMKKISCKIELVWII